MSCTSGYQENAMERLAQTNENTELWWDANPLIYETWCARFLEAAPEEVREPLKQQLRRLWGEEQDPGDWVFKGVTTNPPLTKAVFDYLKDEGLSLMLEIHRRCPFLNAGEIAWEAYKEVCRKGARRYMPLFESSGYRYGFVCAQVDPRLYQNTAEMVRQALELWNLEANMMIKLPATRAGIAAIYLLTAMGVPTNATFSFTLPQIMAVARAVSAGRELGEKLGTNYSRWRSVITFMIGRFEDAETFREQAGQKGIQLTEELKRWAGIALAKKAHRLLKEQGYPGKLLIASSRVGPVVEGRRYIWHIEQLAGGELVYTMNPELIHDFMLLYFDRPLARRIEEPVPGAALEQLLQVPYFVRAYLEDGIPEEEFEILEPFATAYQQFSKAMTDIEAYAQGILSM
ncbi:Aldolase-type TIM barrel [Moorella glycerini]|uniref:Transaldolase n=1 Tax=Neomoorella stamsii TaxID=1266720 RepID=A0A9X7J5E1_9FIRM|nr:MULTISPECIES: transaldolase family protein [Moorella]PRR77515.1 Transaldolase [Moorella stamsii]CEP68264.1 Aldolase-type TIM barrel [Moorella glycerini]